MTGPKEGNKFNDLLLRFSQELEEEDRKKTEKELWELYGKEVTVMVVDMSGFTRLVQKYGIVHYLSMIRRMQLTAGMITSGFSGRVIKFEADNAFLYFDSPGQAINAAISLNLAFSAGNILTPDELDIHISVGIDHGYCLLPHGNDYYGNAVNQASKLGEDLAKPGQILITANAMAMVPKALEIETELIDLLLGGQRVMVHSVIFNIDPKDKE